MSDGLLSSLSYISYPLLTSHANADVLILHSVHSIALNRGGYHVVLLYHDNDETDETEIDIPICVNVLFTTSCSLQHLRVGRQTSSC